MELSGNTVLITGGSSGIGKGFVDLFYKKTNKIIVVGRDERKLNVLKSNYPEIITKKCDLSQKDEVNLLIEFCKIHHSDINVLINNAGIENNYVFNLKSPVKEELIIEEIAINFIAPILLTNGILQLLSTKKDAAIVNITSALVYSPKINAAVYSATKAGLSHFTQALSEQVKASNIKIFEVLPYLTDTPLTQSKKNKKTSVQQLIDEFEYAFKKDKKNIFIGYTKWIYYIHRIAPGFLKYLIRKRYYNQQKY